ncbi:Hydroxyethylthiazole kinase family-domain-containing protein [Limtongia smithiae]|uniref:Hydroxyethylthiazole kinase family-domain-containing protein n=1 Tax=Limtongia smithiae TaxID=1125753 RepID=UPI0034CD4515
MSSLIPSSRLFNLISSLRPRFESSIKQRSPIINSVSTRPMAANLANGRPEVDYSLYLVTDSDLVPIGRTLEEQVAAALAGGTTIVQLREKTADTSTFVALAKRLLKLTRAAGVPLLINDRVDVALAADADGVHVGQSDLDAASVRRLIGPNKLVGLSIGTPAEAQAVCALPEGTVDYVGIGTVYDTATKRTAKALLGLQGVRTVMGVLASRPEIKAVSIGSMNLKTARNTVYKTQFRDDQGQIVSIHGVAVVSALIAASDPAAAARELLAAVRTTPAWALPATRTLSIANDVFAPEAVVGLVRRSTPLVHCIINRVAANFAANIAIAAGASPVMSENEGEFVDLARAASSPAGGALLINLGFPTEDFINSTYLPAVLAYNQQQRPIVLDPIAAGATALRKRAVATLLNHGHFAVIKGNEGEIFAVAGEPSAMRGVDSTSALPLTERARVALKLAQREKTIVCMTGAVDVVSDGTRVVIGRNGHPYLADITASGCVLGTLVAAFVGVLSPEKQIPERVIDNVLAALCLYNIAAERAAALPSVSGPGTFVPALLDQIYALSKQSLDGNDSWFSDAKYELFRMP